MIRVVEERVIQFFSAVIFILKLQSAPFLDLARCMAPRGPRMMFAAYGQLEPFTRFSGILPHSCGQTFFLVQVIRVVTLDAQATPFSRVI
jgi:hypothetical protein